MPGQTYVNPYTPLTPLGAGLQNIAVGLFHGSPADARAGLRATQGDMYDAHSELYREQAKKAGIERQIAARLLGDQGDEAQTDLIGNAAGMPGRRVRAMRDIERGAGDTTAYTPEEWNAYRTGSLAVRPAFADKTISPVDIARALSELKKRGDIEAVIGGTQQAPTVGQAHAAVEARPLYHIGEAGAGNLFTGEQTLNPIGTGRAEKERQHARTYKLEADSGVRIGNPVLVNDPEAGVIYTAPSSAIGRPPGLDPNRARGGAGNGLNETTTQTDLPALKPGAKDNDAMLGGIDRAVGGTLSDKMLEGRILERAQQYFGTPGSPHYSNHESASRQAVLDIMPSGAEQPIYRFGSSGYRPKGETNVNPGPINLSAPTVKTKTVTKGSKPQDTAVRTPSGTQPASQAAPRGGMTKQYTSPTGKAYTDADVQFTATKRGITPQQVIQQLGLREGT